MRSFKAWAAMDEDGKLFLYPEKPKKYKSEWCPDCGLYYTRFCREMFPEVKWEDEEPTEVIITINK